MRKAGIITLSLLCIILCYFTYITAQKAFQSDWELPAASTQKEERYRLVLITQELETPFWDKVGAGAKEQAQRDGASLEVWGSYGKNQEDFLKKLEIAIQSKVDGIIVQGLDTQKFKDLTKIKAAFYGIPIITVANDVPKAESLRKTYVGSDQYLAGEMLAQLMLSDMGPKGNVVLLSDSQKEYYQEQRLKGMREVFSDYPNVKTVYAETADTREQVIATTQDLLNQYPDTNGFIAVNANIAGAMIQEIGRRGQVQLYHIYSFDDGSESISLLKSGKIDGMIEQSPEMMGRKSVNLLIKWLSNEKVPLDADGYLSDVRILKAKD
ncbi:sugar ABC transporter substrate-binding protein [Fictibacillus aquaticus]|uniref:Sugar ABC transporter substrate-binding protein n=1 Tax=Fictibacillus aquaticus TaxID=2021314 RepID=A0A235F655_9BACL|nr:substrate-binding domain-containing protein [Fictibacillus aquaticus]OYD56722.1 sugar ABC transporter substrate-binding protein [Fictibacillus aquaticus]